MKKHFKELEKLHKQIKGAQNYVESITGSPICVRCGFCCEVTFVPFTYLEGKYAVEWLRKQKPEFRQRILNLSEEWLVKKEMNDEAMRKALKSKVEETAKVIVEGGIGTRLLRPEGKDRLQIEANYLITATRCPFYGERECLIYPVRPLACRTFGVTRINASCHRPPGKYEGEQQYVCLREDSPLAPGIQESIDRMTEINQEYNLLDEKIDDSACLFLPIYFMLEFNPYRFYSLLYENLIPTAKLSKVKSKGIYWQQQVESIREAEEEIGGVVNPMRDREAELREKQEVK